MLPRDSQRTRRGGRGRRQSDLARLPLEALEGRALLSYTTLGFSLPDLTISGFAAPAASWGGPLAVSVNLSNIGASTLNEPLNLAPGSVSSADAPASTVAVFATRNPHGRHGVLIGSFSAPLVPQNSEIQLNELLTLPNRPAGFPGDGGKIYVYFVANATNTVLETDLSNNFSSNSPVKIEAPLPDLQPVALDVPPVINPGDTIQPNIEIANLGPASTLPQGPVTVDLVASVTPTFGPGSSILATYQVPFIPGISTVATETPLKLAFGTANLTPQNNVVTITGSPVTLPATPGVYFIGVVVDPAGQNKQIRTIADRGHTNPFSLAKQVGPNQSGLPPAGIFVPGGAANVPAFPSAPVFGLTTNGIGVGTGVTLPPGPVVAGPATSSTTTTAGTVTAASVPQGNSGVGTLSAFSLKSRKTK